jgi:cell division protein FtsA
VRSRLGHPQLIPVNAPGEEATGPTARHADDKNRIPRAELISVISSQLATWVDEVGKALKGLGFTGQRGQLVVLTGGGAELAGLADFAQGALGKPVRLGKPQHLKGLAEAHATPGFSTLSGLVLYAAADPIDIRAIGPSYQPIVRYKGFGLVNRLYLAMREYF